MRLFYLLPLLLIATYGTVHAQTPMKREIGLRSSLGNPLNAGFIYKKQLAENRYRRYRLGFVDATVNIKSPATLSQYTAGAAIGTEFRKDLDDRLQFIHGPEVNASLSVIAVGNANTVDQYTLIHPASATCWGCSTTSTVGGMSTWKRFRAWQSKHSTATLTHRRPTRSWQTSIWLPLA